MISALLALLQVPVVSDLAIVDHGPDFVTVTWSQVDLPPDHRLDFYELHMAEGREVDEAWMNEHQGIGWAYAMMPPFPDTWTLTVEGLDLDPEVNTAFAIRYRYYYPDPELGQSVPAWSGPSNNAWILNDQAAPATIEDLRVTGAGESWIALEWTAPGDDGLEGLASRYEVRISMQAPVDPEAWWNDADEVPPHDVPLPGLPGEAQVMTISGLNDTTPYHVAIRAADEIPNWSTPSRIVSALTPPRPPKDEERGCAGSAGAAGLGIALLAGAILTSSRGCA